MPSELRREWLSRLRHDLVKQVVWRARDLREVDGAPHVADVVALRRGLFELQDADGQPVTATRLWSTFRAELDGVDEDLVAALDGFGRSVEAAEAAVELLDPGSPDTYFRGPRLDAVLTAILSVEDAFTHLARTLSDE